MDSACPESAARSVFVTAIGSAFLLTGTADLCLTTEIYPTPPRRGGAYLLMLVGCAFMLAALLLELRECVKAICDSRCFRGPGGPNDPNEIFSQIAIADPPVGRDHIWACYTYGSLSPMVSVFYQFHIGPRSRPARVRTVSILPAVKVLKDEVCLCCLEDFQPRSQVAVLPCGHVYHASCIIRWSSSRVTFAAQCPGCRLRYDVPGS